MRSEDTTCRLWLAAATLCAVAALACPGWAVSTLNFRASTQDGVGAVSVNGARLLTLRGGGRASISQAAAVARRLQQAAQRGGPKQVATAMVRGAPAVLLDGALLVRVDPRLAAGNNSTPSGLAGLWAERIERAFAQPFIALERDSVAVPLGESRALPLLGNVWGEVSIIADPSIVQATLDPQQQAIRLFGTGRGHTQATIAAGGASLTFSVRVAPWAGAVLPQVVALVTGRLVTGDLLAKAAAFAAYQAVRAQPGASVSVAQPTLEADQILLGQQTTASVQIRLAGEDYLPVTAVTSAALHTTSLTLPMPGLLLVSNQPERLAALGLCCQGEIPPRLPARLLYHHLNATAGPADLVVELANPADQPARLHIIEGLRGPSRDEIFVGHAAARTFLKRMAWNVGYFVNLPPRSRALLAAHRLPPGAIASGLAQVAVVSGPQVLLRVRFLPPSSRPLIAEIEDRFPSPAKPLSVFRSPRKVLTANYTVGGKWAFVSVGRHPVSGENHGETLPGNYGILYDITFEIENPTDQTADLEFAFMSAAGPARGVVLINGALYETRLVRSNQEQALTRFRLPAGTRRRVRVHTIPQAGSNYPIRLVCRPAGSGI